MALGIASTIGLYSLLALVPFIILYLIRPKPKDETIPSIMFLIKQKGSNARASFLRNLLKDLLFIIQLLIILLLAFSVAEPYIESTRTLSAHNVAIVLDVSASMGAGNQWSKAITKAKSSLGSNNYIVLAENTPVTILDGGSRAEALSILNNLNPRATTTNLGDAMTIAADLIDKGKVVVISDFGSTEGQDPIVAKSIVEGKGLGIEIEDVSETFDGNFGITDLKIDKEKTIVYVKNYYKQPKTAKIQIGSFTKDLDIEGESIETLGIETPSGVTKIEIQNNDPLKMDNIAFISTPEKSKLNVLLITNDNKGFISSALRADPGINLEIATPPIIPSLNHDIYIFENIDTNKVLSGTYETIENRVKEGAGVIFVAQTKMPITSLLPVEIKELKTATNIKVDIINQITKDVELGLVGQHFSTKADPNTLVIAKSDADEPIIAIKDLGLGKSVFYGIFDEETDFRYSPSYPIFWHNLINYMVKSQDLADYNFKGGTVLNLGSAQDVKTPTSLLKTATLLLDEHGIYEVGNKKLAVNLIDEKEGRLGKTGRPPEFSSRIDQLTSVKEKEKQSIVPYLLLAAVIMMLFELLYIKRRGDVWWRLNILLKF